MHRKEGVAFLRLDRKAFYRLSWTGMVLALCFSWQDMARADGFDPKALEAAELPDTAEGPGADRIPPGLACRDSMDFSPQDNLPNPFDADSVAYRAGRDGTQPRAVFALPVATVDGCPDSRPPHTDAA
jgi:hypothetical protein